MTKRKDQLVELIDLSGIEENLYSMGHALVCGVDEVGRGPLAGPVVAAAVILPRGVEIPGIDDSKKLTPEKREQICQLIMDAQIPCAVGIIDAETIDKVNILRASLIAMRKAVSELSQTPDCLLVDGTYCIPNLKQTQFAIIGGDARVKSIGAASIIAKVTRDRIMARYQELYPQFSFAVHKGYPTPQHLAELEEHGPCAIHRRSFGPVMRRIEQYALFE
jgi:ribonuclease HII